MNIDFITEIIIIILCLICVITDLRHGLIKNTVLLTVGSMAILMNIISLLQTKNLNYKNYMIEIFFAIIISFTLYFLKIWAGGDCKMYAMIVLALPYIIVMKKILNISMLMYIPIISFGIGYIYIIIDSIIQRIRTKEKSEKLVQQSLKSFIKYLKYYLLVIFVNSIIFAMCEKLQIDIQNYHYITIISVGIVIIVSRLKILEYKSVVLALFIADIFIGAINLELIYSRQTILLWIAIIITSLFKNFSNNYNYDEIDVDELKEGMILSTASSIFLSSDKYGKFHKISEESLKSRLTKADILNIKEIAHRKKQLEKVSIVRKVPFALFISISTIAVILGSILL